MPFRDMNIDPKNILNDLPGGFFLYEAEGEEQLLYANSETVRIFGCESLEEFREYVGNSFRGMVHPEDLDRVHEEINSQIHANPKNLDSVIYRIIRKDGKVRWLDDFGHLVSSEKKATLFYGFQGAIFVLVDGQYLPGEYYEGYLLTYVVVFVYTVTAVFAHARKNGLHDLIASVMFMAIPVLFVMINLRYGQAAFSIPSFAISVMIINTMLQSEWEKDLIASEANSARLAHLDELTGLNNRLAFSEQCDGMAGNEGIGVIFCDVNALKYTNDHFGHKAGDDLLVEFGHILQSVFRREDIFRISGDEFVVLAVGIPQDIFTRKTQELRKQLQEKRERSIASSGWVYGRQAEINQLVGAAEIQMYREKEKFHHQYPALNRGGNQ